MLMLIKEKDRAVIREMFEALVRPVKLVVFTQGPVHLPGERPCEYCEQVVQLAKELGELTDKLDVEIVNFHTDKERGKSTGSSRIPAIAVVGDVDYGIRYYGIPGGFEFATLLEAIIDVSRQRRSCGRDAGKAQPDRQPCAHPGICRPDVPVLPVGRALGASVCHG